MTELSHDEGPAVESTQTWGDRMLVEGRPLSPRHRKLAEYVAQGKTTNEVAELLGYTASRVSVLKSNSRISELIFETQERIYQETVGSRLKKLAEPALNEIEKCLTDQTNRYKQNVKQDTAKWIIEKIDGKAAQKHEVSGGILVGVLDRLDAIQAAGQGRMLQPGMIEVTPIGTRTEAKQIEASPDEDNLTAEEKRLKAWVDSL